MNIHSTLNALYAIMCEAQNLCSTPDRSLDGMRTLLRTVSDDDVKIAVDEIKWLLSELKTVSNKINGMYILHYTTGNDKENKNVLLQTEVVWGTGTIKFITQFDQKMTQSLIDALSMSLAIVKAGTRLGSAGNA